MARTFLWYDLETFGLDPSWDRIAQFACLRTDEDLRPTGERLLLFCKPPPDYLPNPYSCLVHGITPRHALESGLGEYEFATRVRAEMSRPGTTTAGFNSLQFDDEFVRALLYRNLYDPYEREYRRGNSRWDVLDLMRAAHDLRPEGLVWPREEGGRPIFALGALAKANGVAHEAAHDAMHDVLATVDLASLVRSRQPKLYAWYASHRTRESLRGLVDLAGRKALVHTAAAYTSTRGCTTLVAPIALDPANRNQLVAIDLRFDPAPLVDLGVEEIRRRVFTKAGELDEERVPLSRIRLNRCPFLAPLSTLSAEAASRLGIDVDACLARLDTIKREDELIQKLSAVFEPPPQEGREQDPELRLYEGGFFPEADSPALARIHADIAKLGPATAKAGLYALRFEDERPAQLLRRLYARNFPETLGEAEARRWRAFCAARLQLPPQAGATDIAGFDKIVRQRLEAQDAPAREKAVLLALLQYGVELSEAILRYEGK